MGSEAETGNVEAGEGSGDSVNENRITECLKEALSAAAGPSSSVDADNLNTPTEEPNPDAEREAEEEKLTEAELAARLAEAEVLKADANRSFGEGKYAAALDGYCRALRKAPLRYQKERSIMLSNRSATNLKLELFEEAVEDATKSIELGVPNEKPLERRALAYERLGDDHLEKAIADYEKLSTDFPQRDRYSNALKELRRRVDERNERRKAEVMDQLKQLGNLCLRPFGLSTDSFQMVEQPGGGYSIQMKK